VLSGIGARVVSLGFSGLFGWGFGLNSGLALASRLSVGFLSALFGLSGLGFASSFSSGRSGFLVLCLSGLRGCSRCCVAWLLVVPVVASGFQVGRYRVLSGWRRWCFLRSVALRCSGAAGFSGAGQNALSSMPNKSVKGTARRSGWRSF